MNANAVRISSISIQNFKNVVSGSLSFENARKNYKASILGLYGQNGSGKTALIDAIELLQYALCGRQVPAKFADFINADVDTATISADFKVKYPNKTYTISYQISIKCVTDDSAQNTGISQGKSKRVSIVHELIKCPILTDKQVKMGRLIDTDSDEVFSPRPKRILLIGKDKETITDLFVAKKLTRVSSRSFVFSRELLTVIRGRLNSKDLSKESIDEFRFYSGLLEALVEFGNHGLFIINTANSGLISLNAQPLVFKYEEANMGAFGTLTFPLDQPVLIGQNEKDLVEKIISNMNIVLQQIIPGLTISVRDLGTQLLDNGEAGSWIQLVSRKNDKEIALKYESEGIKKIISILQLLIVVYNQPSITVAVDELDSGVFEYLLGELLRIISEKGKGQLIFTSHNLRPLETLDRGFIAFTTTNPKHRYIRMTNVKDNNNLRDFYYRDIMLGGQDEELYETTKNAEIALAFREAGEYSGS